MARAPLKVPRASSYYSRLRWRDLRALQLEPYRILENRTCRTGLLPRFSIPFLTTGFDQFDQAIRLKQGELIHFHGEDSYKLALHLCTRAPLLPPAGPGLQVVYVDGGNSIDSYNISQQTKIQGDLADTTLNKVHVSRAFTTHQLHVQTARILAEAVGGYDARLAIVSDLTQLFNDPDVHDVSEAFRLFVESVRVLKSLAERKGMVVVTTSPQTRNVRMEKALERLASRYVRLDPQTSLTGSAAFWARGLPV